MATKSMRVNFYASLLVFVAGVVFDKELIMVAGWLALVVISVGDAIIDAVRGAK